MLVARLPPRLVVLRPVALPASSQMFKTTGHARGSMCLRFHPTAPMNDVSSPTPGLTAPRRALSRQTDAANALRPHADADPHHPCQPLIRSERLLLRPARGEDLPALHELWCAPEVSRYLGDGAAPTPEQSAQRLFQHLCQARDGLGLWLVKLPAGGAALGCVTLRARTGRQPGMLEPGVALHPSWRGRGYALEALTALLAHAAEALGATDLVACCSVPDVAADKLLRRLGFVAHYECDGGRHRLRQYRPGVRRSDIGLVTQLTRGERRRSG
jgi:RimJ/RimL family protein N-acetyltransferase